MPALRMRNLSMGPGQRLRLLYCPSHLLTARPVWTLTTTPTCERRDFWSTTLPNSPTYPCLQITTISPHHTCLLHICRTCSGTPLKSEVTEFVMEAIERVVLRSARWCRFCSNSNSLLVIGLIGHHGYRGAILAHPH